MTNEQTPVIDLSAGYRNCWFDPTNKNAIFIDNRPETQPTILADSRHLPLPDETADLILFDPPHMNFGATSIFARRYGHLNTQSIRELLQHTATEAHRIAKPNGFLIFKWSSHDTPLKKALDLMPDWEPLFAHTTEKRYAHPALTTWTVLRRRNNKDLP